MTNNDKLKAINEYIEEFYVDAREALKRGGLNSAQWIYAKARFDTISRIDEVIKDIANQ